MNFEDSALSRGLATKGIGPKGLKPMSEADLHEAIMEIAQKQHPDALAATFLMAFQVLERDPTECEIVQQAYLSKRDDFSPELQFIFEIFKQKPKTQMEAFLAKLASRLDLNELECEAATDYLLDESASDAYKAAFLQGLRVKRETDAENLALYRALFSKAPHRTVAGLNDVLVDWSDPYDGFNRHPNLSLLTAVVLAAMGVAVVMHSAHDVGPKYGSTVLGAFEYPRELDLDFGELALKHVNLAILDQAKVFPELHALRSLRNTMRKRPYLATIEKMLMPLKSQTKTVLITGYVHSAYKEAIPNMVMSHGVYDSIFLVKGIEGSVLLDPSKKIPAIYREAETNLDLELECTPRGASPKGELNPSDIKAILSGNDARWEVVEFTVSKILEIALGRSVQKDILPLMTRLKNDGLLLNHYYNVRSFYSRSGEDVSNA